jgi:hypothetical protein
MIDSALCSLERIFLVEYLRKYESIFDSALDLESWDPRVLFAEKNISRKSRETVPLKQACGLPDDRRPVPVCAFAGESRENRLLDS